MSQRITVKDVRCIFDAFVRAADELGFDTTGWILQTGTAWQAYRLLVETSEGRRMGSHPMADYIGSNGWEAHSWLQASVRTMDAVVELNRNPATDVDSPTDRVRSGRTVISYPTTLSEVVDTITKGDRTNE